MLRTVPTLVFLIAALYMALTPRGLLLLGPVRPMLVIALVAICVLQTYRLGRAWQAKSREDRLKRIPKRPLGI
ncbi:MAG: hypothetical protein ABI833_08580 [Acidobacteriota bacterium]